MNIDTNRIYWEQQQVAAAQARGERLMPLQQISDKQGKTKPEYTDGLNRRERRRQAKLARQRAKQR